MRPRPVGIEDACNFDIELVLTPIIEKKRFGPPLAFVIAAARADRIYIAPVVFSLGMNTRISVNFACRSLENLDFQPFRQTKHIKRADNTGFRGLDRIALVMDRGRRTRQIEYLI